MKKRYLKEDIVKLVQRYDKRAALFTPEQIDDVINVAYSELTCVARLFTDELIVDTAPYYEVNEYKFTVEIQKDVIHIYDLYATVEDLDKDHHLHGIEREKNKNIIYRDNRDSGKVLVDLPTTGKKYDNIVLKFFYTPSASEETVYMDNPTYNAFRHAIGVGVYDFVHDVERKMQKLKATHRTALSVIEQDPADYLEELEMRPSLFPSGV